MDTVYTQEIFYTALVQTVALKKPSMKKAELNEVRLNEQVDEADNDPFNT